MGVCMSEERKMPAGLDYQGRHETRGQLSDEDREELERETGSFFTGLFVAVAFTASCAAIVLVVAELVKAS